MDMDMGSPEPMAAPLEPIQPGQVIVRKDYDPKRMCCHCCHFTSSWVLDVFCLSKRVALIDDHLLAEKHKEKGGGMYQNCPNCGQV